jgi:hypothetical protein
MTGRPQLVYPPAGDGVARHPAPAPHRSPPPHPLQPPASPGERAAAPAAGSGVAPVVTYEDPDPPPSGPAAVWRDLGQHPRFAWGALAAILAVLLVLVAIGHAGHAGPGGAPGAAVAPVPARPGPLPGSGHGPQAGHAGGSFTLPPPLGTVPRTVPLETIWIIDATLPAADLAVISREAPVDVRYLATYALPGDQLGFALRRPALRHVTSHSAALAITVAHPAAIVTAEPGRPIRLPPVTRGHDREIVIITTRPARWQQDLPVGLTPPAPTARSGPGQSRTYILGLSPGAGRQADPLTPSETQPQQLTADPAVRGGVARALARAFVDASGSTWRP